MGEKMTNKTQEDNKNDKLSNSSGEQIKKLVKKKESVNNKFKKSLITQNSFKGKGKLVPKTKKSLRDEKAKKVIEKAKKLLDKKTKKTTNVKEDTKKLKKENNFNNKEKKTLNKGKGESDSQPENKNNKKINKYEKSDSTKKVDGNLNIADEVKSVAKKVEAIEDEQKEAEIKNNKVDINIKCSPEKENNEKMKVENKTSEYKLMTESVKVNNFSEPILHSKEKGEIGGKDEKNLPDEQSDTSIDKTEEIIVSPLKTRSKNKGISPRKTRSRKDGKFSRIISKSKIMKRNGLKLIKKKLNNVFDEKKDIKSTLPDVNGLTSVSNKTKDDDAHLFKVPSLPCLQKSLRFNGLKKIKSEASMKMINHAEEKIRKEEAALEQVKNDNIEISNRITRNNKETSIKNDKKQSDNKVSDFETIAKSTCDEDFKTKIKESENTVEKYFSKIEDANNLKKDKSNGKNDSTSKEQIQEARKMRNKNKTLSESSEGSDSETDTIEPRVTRNRKDKSPDLKGDSGSDSETDIIEPRITRNRKDKSPDKKDDKDKSKSIADSDLKNISTEKVVKEA